MYGHADPIIRAIPHNSTVRCAASFSPFQTCKNLDLRPVNHRFRQVKLTKIHLCGIAAALEHFGMCDVMWFKRQKQVADAFRELDKGGRIGVLLMQDGNGPDGTVWTTYGHYLGFVDYRHENEEHLFLLKDSSKRGHNGWYSFERSMGDTLVHVWTCRPDN